MLSPIPDCVGRARTVTREVEAGSPVRAYLPRHQACSVSIDGGVIRPEDYDTRRVRPGEEVLLKPRLAYVPIATETLIYGLILIVVGIALQFAMRALFPPQRPKAQEQDDPTYGFEGIRSTVGPGAKVPIVYGRHRLGGQFLQASVDAGHLTVTDDGHVLTYPNWDQPTWLSLLLSLGEGPIQEIEIASIELNGQPLANFGSILRFYTALGTATQPAIPRFAETRNSFADGREITSGGLLYTTNQAITSYQLTIAFEEGLVAFATTGDKHHNRVVLSIRHRGSPAGPWGAPNQISVRQNKTSVVRVALRREGVPLAVHDIEVSVVHVEHTGSNARFRAFLESVMEIQAGAEAYPGTVLLGLEAVATENLSGAIPNVTVVVKGLRVRVGSFAAVPTWSQNPAWCLLDYLTNPRYGLGVPDAEINLPAFVSFAAYCDELIEGQPRHTLDMVIVEDAEEVIQQILAGCRGILFKIQGQWTPAALRDEPPVQLLSWTNCTNVRLTYTRDPDRINVMEGRFADVEAAWEQSVITWPTEPNWPTPLYKSNIDLRGVTRRAAVIRHLQYELNRRLLPKLALQMECSLEALALTANTIFRFAHPLPGWGISGRLQVGSTATSLRLDEAVTFTPGRVYHCYVRHENDTVETRPVVHPGGGTTQQITLSSPLSQVPVPLSSLYAFGESTPLETAIREFRVVKLERLNDQTIRINAVQHNASIYDDAVATPLPNIDTLFNPLGPPPPLTSLVLTELPRVALDGRTRVVGNLSWDVAALGTNFAPYGGALIYRREVTLNAMTGQGNSMGAVALAEGQSAGDSGGNLVRIATVGPSVLDYDDPLVVTGVTYEYRVTPISMRGVPNNEGSLSGVLHIAGPTTPAFFPGTIANLRLVGQLPGATLFEGPDVHLEWDPLTSVLFTETFFLREYVVEVWAPNRAYLLRRTTTPGERFTYTLQHNTEDQVAAGFLGARRDLLFLVRGRTNTGRESLDNASLQVSNPPPDMSDFRPAVTPLFKACMVDWTSYIEPRDFSHYVVKFDEINPPNATFTSISIALQKVFPQGLTPGTPYYVQIIPFDTFGPGVPSGVAEVIPLSLTLGDLDTTPPSTPTGVQLLTGTTQSTDGTTITYLEAMWDANPEEDLRGYQANFRIDSSDSPTVMVVDAPNRTVRLEGVPGGVIYWIRVAAFDHFGNISPFTSETSIVTGSDTTPPAAPSNLTVRGFFQAHVLSWQSPGDTDVATIEIWANADNDRDGDGLFLVAEVPGSDAFFQHGPLDAGNTSPLLGTAFLGATTTGSNQVFTLYYWLRAKDRSGNVSAWHPLEADDGVGATAHLLTGDQVLQTDVLITNAAQIGTALIEDAHIRTLSASKLIAGTIAVLVRLGAGNIELDAVHDVIRVRTPQGNVTIEMGLLDPGNPQSRNYGMRLYDPNGVLLFDASQRGITAAGIPAGTIHGGHIQGGVISGSHLIVDVAVITTAAQIANALIGTAHIMNAAIETALIADAAITSAKIGTAQVQAAHIGTAAIGTAAIQTAAIGTAQIQDAAITSAKIGTAQIQSAHIQDLSVDNAKIQNLTVGSEKIQNNAVNTTIIAQSSTDGANINQENDVISLLVSDIPNNTAIVLTYMGVITAGPNFTNSYRLRLREDDLGGAVITQAGNFTASGREDIFVGIQGVWHNTGPYLPAKFFHVTIERNNPVPIGDGYVATGNLVMQLHKK